jgi:hypothetical protein
MDVKWKKRKKKARAIEVFREIEIRKTQQNKKMISRPTMPPKPGKGHGWLWLVKMPNVV